MSAINSEYQVIKLLNNLAINEAARENLIRTVDALITACQKTIGYFDECVHSCDDSDTEESVYLTRALLLAKGVDVPVRAVLLCPRCEVMHVDAPEPQTGWTNPPHKTHLCHHCGHQWRPFEFPTCGIEQHASEASPEARTSQSVE